MTELGAYILGLLTGLCIAAVFAAVFATEMMKRYDSSV